jgi:hypothetical protein
VSLVSAVVVLSISVALRTPANDMVERKKEVSRS